MECFPRVLGVAQRFVVIVVLKLKLKLKAINLQDKKGGEG